MGRSKLNLAEVVTAFKSTKPAKKVFGNYRIENNFLIYSANSTKDLPRWHDAKSFQDAKKEIANSVKNQDATLVTDKGAVAMLETLTEKDYSSKFRIQLKQFNTIAVKVPRTDDNGLAEDLIFCNSETLDLIGRTVAYGNEDRNTRITEVQVLLRNSGATMVPLDNILDADFSAFKMLDRGKSRGSVILLADNSGWRKHGSYRDPGGKLDLTGSILFDLGSKRYLADLDSREAANSRLYYSLVEVSKKVFSVKEAELAVLPKEVRDAKLAGLDVKRIDNTYFIPVDAPKLRAFTKDEIISVMAASTYGLDATALAHLLAGSEVSERKREGVELLEQVPRARTLPGGGTAKIALKQADSMLVTGVVERAGFTGLRLAQWHIVVEGGKHG